MSWAASIFSSSEVSDKDSQLPLVGCPECGEGLIKIRSKQPGSYDEIFIKCLNNIRSDPTTCNFIRTEKQYGVYLRKRGNIEGWKQRGGDTDLKQQVDGIKQELDGVLVDLMNLKVEMAELKSSKMGVWDNSVLAILCLGVVTGMFVSLMCK